MCIHHFSLKIYRFEILFESFFVSRIFGCKKFLQTKFGAALHSGLNWGVMWTFEYMVYLAFQLDFNYHIFGSIPILLHGE